MFSYTSSSLVPFVCLVVVCFSPSLLFNCVLHCVHRFRPIAPTPKPHYESRRPLHHRAPTSASNPSPKPPSRRPGQGGPVEGADSGANQRPSGGGAGRRPVSGDFDGISDENESLFPESSQTDDDSQYS